ncbi:MAG: hypothetical protein RL603_1642 [Pseudomonadota bacterium]|jgi:hypothetical protein
MKHSTTSLLGRTVAIAVMTAIAGQYAHAQGAGGAGESLALEEIVVTARKKEESLQDVPLTVTAVSAAKIEELAIRDSRDLALYTPGFSNVSSFGRSSSERPVIRGQSNILGDPNASYFIDGVYISGSATNTETANLERIEVIKGPQAALYGRATFAGAINYVTKRPSKEFEGKASVSIGQRDALDASAFVSGPLIADRLFYYAAISRSNYGGVAKNPYDSRADLGEERTDSGTIKFLLTPNENFEIGLLATHSKDRDGGIPIGLQGREYNNCQLRSTALPRSRGYYCGEVISLDKLVVGQRTDLFPDGGGVRRERDRVVLSGKYGFGAGYELAASAAYSKEKYGNNLDVSYAGYDPYAVLDPATPVAAGAAGDVTRQFRNAGSFWRIQREGRDDVSLELRLRSPSDRAFRWTVGGYRFKGGDDLLADDKAYPDGRIVPNGSATLTFRDIKNTAVFAGIEYDILESLTATAEYRSASEEKSQTSNQYTTASPTVRVPADSFAGTFKSKKPRFTLRYKANPDLTLFANVAEGNKPGGFNSGSIVFGLQSLGKPVAYSEEESKNYELGAKFKLLEGRAFVSLTAFDTELSNQQLTQNIVYTSATGSVAQGSFIENVGKTNSKGLELEVTARVTENFDLSFGGAYVDAKIKQYLNSDQADLYSNRPSTAFTVISAANPGGCGTLGASVAANTAACAALRLLDNQQFGDVAGKRTPRAPKLNGFVVGKYTKPLADDMRLVIGGDVTYEGSKYAQVHNLIETGSRAYLGARIGVENDRWNVTLWGKNLTDDDTPLDILRYVDSRGTTAATALTTRAFAITLPRPRQVGISANYKF